MAEKLPLSVERGAICRGDVSQTFSLMADDKFSSLRLSPFFARAIHFLERCEGREGAEEGVDGKEF